MISGTPSAGGTFSFVVQVTDAAAVTANSGTLSIVVAASAPAIQTTTLPSGTLNVAYTATVTAIGGTQPYTWSLDASSAALPTGLTLDPNAGTISGTPTQSGLFNLIVDVADSSPTAATDTQALALTISTPTGGLPAIGRRGFGGDEASWTFAYSGNSLVKAAGVQVTFWSALTGGSQYTDLTDSGNNPVTSVTTDSNGRIPAFNGPANIWLMAADANAGNGPRQWILATDIGAEINILYSALQGLVG